MVLLTTTPAKAKREAYDSTPTRLMGHLGIPTTTTVVSQRSQGSLHFHTQQAVTKALFSPHRGGGNSEHQDARHLTVATRPLVTVLVESTWELEFPAPPNSNKGQLREAVVDFHILLAIERRCQSSVRESQLKQKIQ